MSSIKSEKWPIHTDTSLFNTQQPVAREYAQVARINNAVSGPGSFISTPMPIAVTQPPDNNLAPFSWTSRLLNRSE